MLRVERPLTIEGILSKLRTLMRRAFFGTVQIGFERGRPTSVTVNETFRGDDELEVERGT